MKQKQSFNSLQTSFQAKQKQSYAPFGSVSPRGRKKKKGQQKKQVGPGAYDISLPIVQPIVQTFKKKNNNIIVKLAHIGTSSFQGEKDRFANQFISQVDFVQKIGPGKYSPQKSFEYLQKSRVDRSAQFPQRKKAGLQLAKFLKHRQRRTATFSEVKKIEIDDYVEMPAALSKQQQIKTDMKNKLNKIKGVAWSMMKQERLRKMKNQFANLGPGKYYVDDFTKKQPMRKNRSISEEYPAFKSESIRSFFDNIKFQTNHEQKASLRQANGYKSDSIGPGTYEILQKNTKQNRFQFFGSTVQRI